MKHYISTGGVQSQAEEALRRPIPKHEIDYLIESRKIRAEVINGRRLWTKELAQEVINLLKAKSERNQS